MSIAREIKDWLKIALLVAITAAAIVLYTRYRTPEPETKSRLSDEIVVMRTNGGWLEVSTVKATEVFDRTVDHEILWINVGQTATSIRVPAHYTYRARLASEWKILRRGDEFIVVAPAIEPKLPVAVELDKMEKQSHGFWSPFTGAGELDALERSMAANLKRKARSRLYLNLQREAARTTIAEFVKKWLITQVEFRDLQGLRMRVLFRDEPLESLGPVAAQLFQ